MAILCKQLELSQGDICDACGKRTMRPSNPDNWNQRLDEQRQIKQISHELKCSSCGHSHINENLTARISSSVEVTVISKDSQE